MEGVVYFLLHHFTVIQSGYSNYLNHQLKLISCRWRKLSYGFINADLILILLKTTLWVTFTIKRWREHYEVVRKFTYCYWWSVVCWLLQFNIFIVPLGFILRFSLFILIVMSIFDVNGKRIVGKSDLKNDTKGFAKTSHYLCGMTIVNHKFVNVSWIFLHFIHY